MQQERQGQDRGQQPAAVGPDFALQLGDAHANGHGPKDMRAEEKGELVGDAIQQTKNEINEIEGSRFIPQRRIRAPASQPTIEAQEHTQQQELVEEEDEVS